MARRSRRSQRDTNVIASPLLDNRTDLLGATERSLRSLFQEIEDLREYHPEGINRAARAISRSSAREKIGKESPFTRQVKAFVEPDRVALCVRRKRRREVLFAKRKTRKGSGGAKRLNWRSFIHC